MRKQSKVRNLLPPFYQQTGVQPLPSRHGDLRKQTHSDHHLFLLLSTSWARLTVWDMPLVSRAQLPSLCPLSAPCALQPAWRTSTAQQQLKQCVLSALFQSQTLNRAPYKVLQKKLSQQTQYNRALADSGWMRTTWRSALNSPNCCSQKWPLSFISVWFTLWKGNDATVPLSSQGSFSLSSPHLCDINLDQVSWSQMCPVHIYSLLEGAAKCHCR